MLGICIPTFNRGKYLREALISITEQFSDQDVAKNVNVFILDNRSDDDTEKISADFTSRFSNIKYVKDSQRRGMAKGLIKAASLSADKYIWIFSDDDKMYPGCLKKILSKIKNNDPDLVICNIDSFIDDNKIYQKNLFKDTVDYNFANRKEFFVYLNTKFYYDIDYYTTFCSNWVLKKDYYDKTKHIFDKYNDERLDLSPFLSLIFYSGEDYRTSIIGESLVMFRSDNTSWGYKNSVKHFLYQDAIWQHYYKNIDFNNRDVAPYSFRFNVKIKNLLRYKDFLFMLFILFLKKIKLFNFVRNIYKKLLFR